MFVIVRSLSARCTVCGVGIVRVLAPCARIVALNWVGERVFISLHKPALGNLLIQIYSVCFSLFR